MEIQAHNLKQMGWILFKKTVNITGVVVYAYSWTICGVDQKDYAFQVQAIY